MDKQIYDGNMMVTEFTWVFKYSGKTLDIRECVQVSFIGSESGYTGTPQNDKLSGKMMRIQWIPIIYKM